MRVEVPEGDVVTLMETELDALVSLLGDLPTDRETYRPGQTVYFRGVVRAEKDVQYRLPDLP